MTSSPALFVELCAGTAALSLRLHGGRYARPPVSRMGAKTGYGEALLHIMGLAAGDRAEHYLWCEPDPGCRLLLEAYRDHQLAQQAAEIIRGWSSEDPRQLWERLRAEGPVQDVDPREVARRMVLSEWSINDLVSWSYCGPGKVAASGLVPFAARLTPHRLAARLPIDPTLPASLTTDARQVDPREVARWLQIVSSNRLINMGPDWMNTGEGGTRYGGDEFATPVARTIRHLEQLPEMPASLTTDARQLHPAPLPGRIVVYLDPPYQGTTGYGHDLNRDEVITLAMRWVDAGADVYISEAERIQIPGWHHVDITGCRRGQKRTFSKQQREWVSCSRRPHWSPASQVALW